jgi:hypothetical protein
LAIAAVSAGAGSLYALLHAIDADARNGLALAGDLATLEECESIKYVGWLDGCADRLAVAAV